MTVINNTVNKDSSLNIINKIFIATLPNGYFGLASASWKTINTDLIAKHLIKDGYNCTIVPVDKLLDITLNHNDIVIYTSSDEERIRAYLRDVLYIVSKKCTIVPSYETLLAHENKGFQQLLRNEKHFGDLEGNYSFDFDDLSSEFPYVYKQVTGAGSSGVSLIKDETNLKSVKKDDFKLTLKRKVINYARKIKLSTEDFSIYNYRNKGFNLYVTQEFIEGLSYDYKVLVFGNRYYILKRNVKKNDFRASGSGDFSFEDAPEILLSYAKNIYNTLDLPYASLDLAISNDKCKLIEYQGLNFGPYTLLESPGYYLDNGDDWSYVKDSSNLEENYSLALSFYIDNLKAQ